MTTRQQALLLFGAACFAIALLFILEQSATVAVSVFLRLHVTRLGSEYGQRTYQIEIADERGIVPLRGARVLLITQARDEERSEITVIAREAERPGAYRARVPFSRDGNWYVHVGLNEPYSTHTSFEEEIIGTWLAPPIPTLEAVAEPVGQLTPRVRGWLRRAIAFGIRNGAHGCCHAPVSFYASSIAVTRAFGAVRHHAFLGSGSAVGCNGALQSCS